MSNYVENCVCESCEYVGLCIRLADDCVLCSDCFQTHEEIATEIESEISRGDDFDEIDDGTYDIDPAEYDASDEFDMYGTDDCDNEIAMGRWDE